MMHTIEVVTDTRAKDDILKDLRNDKPPLDLHSVITGRFRILC